MTATTDSSEATNPTSTGVGTEAGLEPRVTEDSLAVRQPDAVARRTVISRMGTYALVTMYVKLVLALCLLFRDSAVLCCSRYPSQRSDIVPVLYWQQYPYR